MNTVQTSTQKYNDLKALVKRSYADEKERNEMWEYIAGYILANNGNEIQENNLEAFSRLTEHKGLLAHIDIVVDATDLDKRAVEMEKAFLDAIDKAWPNPWVLICYGKTIGTDHELNRFFYMKKEV